MNDVLDRWPRHRVIDGYFADYRTAAVLVRTPRAEPKPIPQGSNPAHDGRLFDWLTEMLYRGPEDGPERAWPIILELVARAPDEGSLKYVGCGPIEDLVNRAGEPFAERILNQARNDPRFWRAVGDVWFHGDVPAVLKEVILASRADDAIYVVEEWFAERGFAIAITEEDGACWATLKRAATGDVVAPRYGRGRSPSEAAERAKKRWLEEQ